MDKVVQEDGLADHFFVNSNQLFLRGSAPPVQKLLSLDNRTDNLLMSEHFWGKYFASKVAAVESLLPAIDLASCKKERND